MSQANPTVPGQAVYTPLTLRLYDAWVHGISNPLAWGCPTRRLRDHFNQHLSDHHLDVGVGTGYFLRHAAFAPTARLSLLDMNAACLDTAARRANLPVEAAYQRDVFQPLALSTGPFSSISLFYLLHCLPGTMPHKARAIANLAHHLTPDGTLYGATILGRGVHHNPLGRSLMRTYNRKGIFSNLEDDEQTLAAALKTSFQHVQIEVVGRVALFTASPLAA